MNNVAAVSARTPVRPRPSHSRRASDFPSARAPEPLRPATPARSAPSFEHDVMLGLTLRQKTIPATWLHDHRGSELFEQITQLDEYYASRNETRILERCAGQIAEAAGARSIVIELGSGSSRKTPLLLAALDAPQVHLSIDVSGPFLAESLAGLPSGRRILFLLGSTIGHFSPDEAVSLLTRIGRAAGPDALLIVGADTTQDPAVLIPAYDDRQGVTGAFNLNLLTRINRELGADFSPTAFRHEARFNAEQQRVEMHLVSTYTQRVTVCGHPFQFAMGESIHTGNAYKHGLLKFQHLAARAGWSHRQLWMDGQSRVAVHVLEASPTVRSVSET
jgi:L-histidine N-alpha-methyltransferase